jgi:hypothetical protein
MDEVIVVLDTKNEGQGAANQDGRPEVDDMASLFGTIDPADLRVDDTSWMRAFSGDLRTLDVVGLWQAAGLRIVPWGDGISFRVQCPNRMEHSDPESPGGTVIYKRPGAMPRFFCARTKCRGGQFTTREALLSLGTELVDQHCAMRFR